MLVLHPWLHSRYIGLVETEQLYKHTDKVREQYDRNHAEQPEEWDGGAHPGHCAVHCRNRGLPVFPGMAACHTLLGLELVFRLTYEKPPK